ncbi:tyrosine-type recombinase/integrase [Aliivibrio fischeri]|uniref:phage integrase n=1 Tax=Aliivibrio fischeri TaxID=668 RepID=UPI000B32E908|nr:tyrosine-type recombinase/integrase [Aliivibrio fischeri]
MINQSGDGQFFTTNDPYRFFKLERDARNHEKTLLLRGQSLNINKDSRKLNDVIDIWHRLHGKTLRDSTRLLKLLYRVSERLGNPIASDLTNEQFARYRELRTSEVSTTTVNREHAYLRAVFNELKRLGTINYDNPLSSIRLFKEREGELRFLTHAEISLLLSACSVSSNKSLLYVVKVCLATRARWSEAETLKMSQVHNNKITFLNTKNGKNRTIPINDHLFNELLSLGKSGDEKLFISSLSAFRKAITKSLITLPREQMSHVLRHSFASHFVMNGGNICIKRYFRT